MLVTSSSAGCSHSAIGMLKRHTGLAWKALRPPPRDVSLLPALKPFMVGAAFDPRRQQMRRTLELRVHAGRVGV